MKRNNKQQVNEEEIKKLKIMKVISLNSICDDNLCQVFSFIDAIGDGLLKSVSVVCKRWNTLLGGSFDEKDDSKLTCGHSFFKSIDVTGLKHGPALNRINFGNTTKGINEGFLLRLMDRINKSGSVPCEQLIICHNTEWESCLNTQLTERFAEHALKTGSFSKLKHLKMNSFNASTSNGSSKIIEWLESLTELESLTWNETNPLFIQTVLKSCKKLRSLSSDFYTDEFKFDTFTSKLSIESAEVKCFTKDMSLAPSYDKLFELLPELKNIKLGEAMCFPTNLFISLCSKCSKIESIEFGERYINESGNLPTIINNVGSNLKALHLTYGQPYEGDLVNLARSCKSLERFIIADMDMELEGYSWTEFFNDLGHGLKELDALLVTGSNPLKTLLNIHPDIEVINNITVDWFDGENGGYEDLEETEEEGSATLTIEKLFVSLSNLNQISVVIDVCNYDLFNSKDNFENHVQSVANRTLQLITGQQDTVVDNLIDGKYFSVKVRDTSIHKDFRLFVSIVKCNCDDSIVKVVRK